MLTEQQKAELEAIIRKAVPESSWHICTDCIDGVGHPECITQEGSRPLTLQDVFIALPLNVKILRTSGERGSVIITAWVMSQHSYMDIKYDLTKDYSGQSPEFYHFLHLLLCQ